MTEAPSLLLKLLVAHLAGDYLFQSSRIAREKMRPRILVLHVALHAALLAVVAITEPPSGRLIVGLLLVLAIHAATDAWTSRRRPQTLRLLALDQSLHLAAIVVAAAIARPDEFRALGEGLATAAARRAPWWIAGGVLLAVPAGAVVIGRWVRPFQEALSDESRDQRHGLELAGRWIGMLERLLVFVAVLARLESLIGFVIAVKAVLRLPEAREKWSRELAEYYLVGSLASLAWALVIALAVRIAVGAG